MTKLQLNGVFSSAHYDQNLRGLPCYVVLAGTHGRKSSNHGGHVVGLDKEKEGLQQQLAVIMHESQRKDSVNHSLTRELATFAQAPHNTGETSCTKAALLPVVAHYVNIAVRPTCSEVRARHSMPLCTGH